MSEAKSPNGRHKPHVSRTVNEWLKIYHRVVSFQGVTNGRRIQCPVCFGMFEPATNHKHTRFCSRACRNTWRTAKMHAAKFAGIHYTKPEVIAAVLFGRYATMTNPPMHTCKAVL